MADFVKLDEQHWLGASTDDKPDPTVIDVGAEALEYDTGDRYIADGTTWRGPVTQASVTADTSSLNALVGALASSAVTDPAALSATLLELARGQLSFLAELGTSADAKVTSDAAGTIAAYLRGVTYTLNTLLPAALGQGTQAQGLRIAWPSDAPTVVTSIDGTPTVSVSSEPALGLTTDVVGTSKRSRSLMAALVEKTVTIVTGKGTAGTTDGSIVAAQAAGITIAVAWFMVVNTSTSTDAVFTFNTKPAGAGTALIGLNLAAKAAPQGADRNEDGWFQTTAAQALSYTCTGADCYYTLGWFPSA